jgi:hypothetical protein
MTVQDEMAAPAASAAQANAMAGMLFIVCSGQ